MSFKGYFNPELETTFPQELLQWRVFLKMIFLFMAVLSLCSCSRRSLVVVHELLIAVVSLTAEYGLRAQAQYLRCTGLVSLWHVESSQTSDRTLLPRHWQADSYPLCHQGSPKIIVLNVSIMI